MLDCYATGNVTPSYRDFGKTPVNGRLIGLVTSSNTILVQRCYATGTVATKGEASVGGLIGNIGAGNVAQAPVDLKVLNNMVLVPAMSGLGTGNYGRVGGLGTKTWSAMLPASSRITMSCPP